MPVATAIAICLQLLYPHAEQSIVRSSCVTFISLLKPSFSSVLVISCSLLLSLYVTLKSLMFKTLSKRFSLFLYPLSAHHPLRLIELDLFTIKLSISSTLTVCSVAVPCKHPSEQFKISINSGILCVPSEILSKYSCVKLGPSIFLMWFPFPKTRSTDSLSPPVVGYQKPTKLSGESKSASSFLLSLSDLYISISLLNVTLYFISPSLSNSSALATHGESAAIVHLRLSYFLR